MAVCNQRFSHEQADMTDAQVVFWAGKVFPTIAVSIGFIGIVAMVLLIPPDDD